MRLNKTMAMAVVADAHHTNEWDMVADLCVGATVRNRTHAYLDQSDLPGHSIELLVLQYECNATAMMPLEGMKADISSRRQSDIEIACFEKALDEVLQ